MIADPYVFLNELGVLFALLVVAILLLLDVDLRVKRARRKPEDSRQ